MIFSTKRLHTICTFPRFGEIGFGESGRYRRVFSSVCISCLFLHLCWNYMLLLWDWKNSGSDQMLLKCF